MRAGVLVGTLLVTWAMSGASCAAGAEAGYLQQTPSMEQVRRAWQARQDRVRTARIAWTEKRFVAARSKWPRRDGKAPGRLKDGEWLPERDLTFESTGEIALSGKMLRYVHEGAYWHDSFGELLQKKYVATFDAETAQSHFTHTPPRVHGLRPLGFIDPDPRHPNTRYYMLKPVLMTFRACDPDTGGVDPAKYAVSAKTAFIDQALCVGVTWTGKRRDQTTFWVDPQRDFLVLRIAILDGSAHPVATTDISYQRDALHGWVPSGWKWVYHGGFSSVREQAAAKVTRCEINVDIPRSEFQIDYPPGTLVRNLKTKEDYIVRPDYGKRPITKAEIARGATYEEYLSTESGMAGLKKPALAQRVLGWTVGGLVLLVVVAVFWRLRARAHRREGDS